MPGDLWVRLLPGSEAKDGVLRALYGLASGATPVVIRAPIDQVRPGPSLQTPRRHIQPVAVVEVLALPVVGLGPSRETPELFQIPVEEFN